MERTCGKCGSTEFTPTKQHDGVPKPLRGTDEEPLQKHRWFTCDGCGATVRENIPEKEQTALYGKAGA